MEDKLVTVILLGENSDNKNIQHVIKNIFDQTHKNIDLVVSTFKEVEESFKEECSKLSLNIRWLQQNPSSDFFKELIDLADGDYIFYKTLNNILWYPRHIQSHLEEFKKNRNAQWAFSHVEYKDVNLGDHPFNVISYRIDNPPNLDRITIDEVCHSSKLATDWTQCLRQDKNGNPFFLAGYVAQQWNKNAIRGCIPPEITLANWVDPKRKSSGEDTGEKTESKLGAPISDQPVEETKMVDGEVVIERKWPTIVGNSYFSDRNNKLRELIESNVSTEDIKSIALKRTMGMGDVLLVEPIIKKLREKYTNAVINLYTSKESIVEYFENKPDSITRIGEKELSQDYLDQQDEDLKFDLDLSYESRENTSFVDAYADVCFIDFNDQKDKHASLVSGSWDEDDEIKTDKKIAVVCADGSGWHGKSWPLSYYEDVVEYLLENDYYVIETGKVTTDLTPKKYHDCDFDTMVKCISSASLYVGGDNGPMHIARGYNVPCVIIAGAALPYYSNPNRDNIYYLENPESEGWGIKHRFFFGPNGDGGITFVPHCDEDPYCGLRDVSSKNVIDAIQKLTAENYKLNISGSFVKEDIVGGLAYYKSDYGLERENKFYHPDQNLDLSEYYEEDTEDYFEEYLTIPFDFVSKLHNGGKVLDLGCNMGILTRRLLNFDMDAYGIDINSKSVDKSKIVYDMEEGRVTVKDALDTDSYEGNYQVIVCNDMLDKVSEPQKLLQNIHSNITDDGSCVLGIQVVNVDDLDQRSDIFSIGENINIFDKGGVERLFSENGFSIKEIRDNGNGFVYYNLIKS
jgi:2-polyprenyl-3-methyl-5-hydroxy-6-metoxy-1,4-benzoquinol methylase